MKKKYFLRKFARYFLLFTCPVIIIGIILSIYTFIQIRKDINIQAQSTFRIGTELMEEILMKGDDISVMLNNNAAVSTSMWKILNQNSLNYKEYLVNDLMLTFLKNTKVNCDYMESIYIYMDNEKEMFFHTDETILSLKKAPDNEWFLHFREKDASEGEWVEKRSMRNYQFEPLHDCLSIYRRIPNYKGVVVTNLDISALSSLLSSIENYTNESIIVTDSNGMLLFSNDNAKTLELDADRAVTHQFTVLSGYGGNSPSTIRFQEEEYILTEFSSGHFGLRFFSMVPKQDIYALMYQVFFCVIAGIAVAGIFCVVFSYMVTNRNFRQIENLMNILWEAETGQYHVSDYDSPRLDEYNLIFNQVIHTFVRNNTLTMQLKEEELKQTTSELKALQLQINPHFFFNTLQSIDMEIIKQMGKDSSAGELIHYLSDILRYSLEDSSRPVPLEEEIQSCREYFFIQQFHYPGQVTLLWDYEDGVLQYPVLRLMFQPLVENSIRYSISTPEDTCIIRIKILDKGMFLRIHVLDTGIGMTKEKLERLRSSLSSPEERRHHIGVKNTHKRLQLAYPGNDGLTIISRYGQGTCISFSVPK